MIQWFDGLGCDIANEKWSMERRPFTVVVNQSLFLGVCETSKPAEYAGLLLNGMGSEGFEPPIG